MDKFGEILNDPSLTIEKIESIVAPLRASYQTDESQVSDALETTAFEGRSFDEIPGAIFWEEKDLVA